MRLDLIAGVGGIGLKTAVAILLRMPEIGRVTREQAAALAGLAPMMTTARIASASGTSTAAESGCEKSLSTAALAAAFHWNPQRNVIYRRLIAAGKSRKVAIVACARKLLIYANTAVERGTPSAERPAAI